MQISFTLLLTLAKVCEDEEAEKALSAYQDLCTLGNKSDAIRIWMVAGSYQLSI